MSEHLNIDPNTTPPDRVIVVVVGDRGRHGGWTVDLTRAGTVYRTPHPISATACGDYLRLLLPELGPDPAVADEPLVIVRLDPDRLADCAALAAALHRQTGVVLDPGAVRNALRSLDSGTEQ